MITSCFLLYDAPILLNICIVGLPVCQLHIGDEGMCHRSYGKAGFCNVYYHPIFQFQFIMSCFWYEQCGMNNVELFCCFNFQLGFALVPCIVKGIKGSTNKHFIVRGSIEKCFKGLLSFLQWHCFSIN